MPILPPYPEAREALGAHLVLERLVSLLCAVHLSIAHTQAKQAAERGAGVRAGRKVIHAVPYSLGKPVA